MPTNTFAPADGVADDGFISVIGNGFKDLTSKLFKTASEVLPVWAQSQFATEAEPQTNTPTFRDIQKRENITSREIDPLESRASPDVFRNGLDQQTALLIGAGIIGAVILFRG